MISIEMMSKENCIDIYSFEKENRDYFEKNLPPRPDNYFNLNTFQDITNELLVKQDNHDIFMHVIRNSRGDVVGRINLVTEILRQYFINHPQSIDKYTFLQNSAFTHWVKENYSPHKGNSAVKIPDVHWRLSSSYQMFS